MEQLDEDEDIREGGESIEDDVKWGEGGKGGGGGGGEQVEKGEGARVDWERRRPFFLLEYQTE